MNVLIFGVALAFALFAVVIGLTADRRRASPSSPPAPPPQAARALSPEDHLRAARETIMSCAPGDLDALAVAVQALLVRSCEEAINFDRQQEWRVREKELHEDRRLREKQAGALREVAWKGTLEARRAEIASLREQARQHSMDACRCTLTSECARVAEKLRKQADDLEEALVP